MAGWMTANRPIIVLHDAQSSPPVFVAGRRAAARVYVERLDLDNVSAAPAEGFRHVQMEPLGATVTRTEVCPNRVVTTLADAQGGTITWTTFAAREEPWIAVLIDRTASNTNDQLSVTLRCTPNVDYIHKFAGTGKQDYAWIGSRLNVACRDHPELAAAITSSGRVNPISSPEGEFVPGESLTAHLSFTGREEFIVFGAGEAGSLGRCLAGISAPRVQRELLDVISEEAQALDSGVQLDTPDVELNRFFNLSRIWFQKNVRTLPFGPPYSTDASRNEEIEVLTASPDYHGVFANDNVQTALEGMIVGPSLKYVYENGLDVLYKHSANCFGYIPEAVEFWLGRQEVFIQGLKIGQHPEWVVSLASVALLSGDRELGKRLWPGVELALQYFVDMNGDGVNEWDTAAYPEQPDTTGYRNGMLYAQAWWAWAFERAAELGKFLGMNDKAEILSQRATAAREAMERVFGRADGFGVWLSPEGKLHPHQGHCMIIPVALGLCTQDRADKVIGTMVSPGVWLEPYGPLRANRGSEIHGGDRVWGFMRWQFVQALVKAGKADLAVSYAGAWARQELESGLLAPESFPTPITGITGQGYVWTAGRAIRSLTYGLFGLNPMADGIVIQPQLPSQWDHMALKGLPYRGKTMDIDVASGSVPLATLNGESWCGPLVRDTELQAKHNHLMIVVDR